MNYDELSRKLGYSFANKNYLQMALTHRSFGSGNNERLEFLGDAIVNFIMAEVLFQRYPNAQEGDLSRIRATLVNRDTLAQLGRQFELGRFIRFGAGELKSGGNQRQSIISCTMEAVIGAIYLDSDFERCRECILTWYQDILENLSDASSYKDPKTALQEHLQQQRKSLPTYVVESVEGQTHKQRFKVSCKIRGIKEIAHGEGSSRKRAEQSAAANMLKIIQS